jgi:hypothetical protein
MSVSGLIFLLIWGILIVLVLILLWHPQRSANKANIPADHQRLPRSSAMIGTGMVGSFTAIPMILRCSSKSATV